MRRFAILLLLAAAAVASDLRKALEAARQQEPRAAANGIANALDASPSRDEAAHAIVPSDWPVLAALAARPEGAPVVKRLLLLAYGQVPPKPPDPAVPQAEDLAKAVVFGQTYAERFDASTRLIREYGERAAPCLLPYLKHQDTVVVINAHLGIMRAGGSSTLPLTVAVRAEGDTRRFVAQQLGAIDDPRGLAVLIELAEKDGADSPAARAAAKLRAKHNAWAGDGSAASAHLALARNYFEGVVVVRMPPQPVLWILAGDQLTSRLADRHLCFIELAKRAAEDSLRLDPKSEAARTLLENLRKSEEFASKLVADLR